MNDDTELLKMRIAALELSLSCMTHAKEDYERIARNALDEVESWRTLFYQYRSEHGEL